MLAGHLYIFFGGMPKSFAPFFNQVVLLLLLLIIEGFNQGGNLDLCVWKIPVVPYLECELKARVRVA